MRLGSAQSFLESSSSTSPLLVKRQHDFLSHATAKASGTCSCQCHCGTSAGGAQRTSKRSRSQTSLRTGISELPAWEWNLSPPEPIPNAVQHNGPGESVLERLPIELLGMSSLKDFALRLLIYDRRDTRTGGPRSTY